MEADCLVASQMEVRGLPHRNRSLTPMMTVSCSSRSVIVGFRDKGLERLYRDGSKRGVQADNVPGEHTDVAGRHLGYCASRCSTWPRLPMTLRSRRSVRTS
jgi:hypothetical protein